MAVYISIRRTLHGFNFWGFFDYLHVKEDGVQFRILLILYALVRDNLVNYSVQIYNITY